MRVSHFLSHMPFYANGVCMRVFGGCVSEKMIILYLRLLLLYSRGYGMGRNRGPRRRRAGILPFGYAVPLLSLRRLEGVRASRVTVALVTVALGRVTLGTRYSQRGKAWKCAEFAGP